MAPTAPTKRKPLRLKSAERLANPLLPRKVHRPDSAVTDAFLSSKTDKRLIKHSTFVSRITKPAAAAAAARPGLGGGATPASRKNAKRAAAAKKRADDAATNNRRCYTLDALADALPALTAAEVAGGQTERDGRVRHKSLGSKRGALKKKERVVRSEMERFGLSLAQLETVKEREQPLDEDEEEKATGGDDETMGGVGEAQPSAVAGRFAALRGFIAATMEQNPAFAAAQKAGGKGP